VHESVIGPKPKKLESFGKSAVTGGPDLLSAGPVRRPLTPSGRMALDYRMLVQADSSLTDGARAPLSSLRPGPKLPLDIIVITVDHAVPAGLD
jgi:hypothetical protein